MKQLTYIFIALVFILIIIRYEVKRSADATEPTSEIFVNNTYFMLGHFFTAELGKIIYNKNRKQENDGTDEKTFIPIDRPADSTEPAELLIKPFLK